MNKNKILVIILAILLFSTGVLFLVLAYLENKKPGVETLATRRKIESIEKTYPEDFKGKVYLTLKNTNTVGIYSFDLNDNELKEIYVFSGCYNFGGEISSVKNEMLISSNCGLKKGLIPQIKILDLDNNKTGDYLTDSNFFDKKEMVWSADGKNILYSAYSDEINEKFETLKEFDLWDVYSINDFGKEKYLVKGFTSFFSPDGNKTITLKNEHLLLMDLKDGSEKTVYSFEYDKEREVTIGLSKNREFLAISNPVEDDISIFKIISWEDFALEEVKKIKIEDGNIESVKFYSENENYLIFTKSSEKKNNGGLFIYDINSDNEYKLDSLEEYLLENSQINYWK